MYVRVAPLGAVLARVCPVGYTGTEGILGGHTKYAEVLGTGIEAVPKLTEDLSRVFTYLPSKISLVPGTV